MTSLNYLYLLLNFSAVRCIKSLNYLNLLVKSDGKMYQGYKLFTFFGLTAQIRCIKSTEYLSINALNKKKYIYLIIQYKID